MAKAQGWKTLHTTSGTGEKISLAEGYSGEIYMGFRDYFKGKTNVKKYMNGQWSWVGDSAFCPEWIGNMKLAIDKDSMPVVAYTDINKKYQLTVMKYKNNKWDTLGTRGFTGFTSNGDFSIATGNGNIFVCYQQFNIIKVWVYNRTNNAWDYVGTNGQATTGFPSGCDLNVFNSKLYLTYRENSGKNIVAYVDAASASPSSVWTQLGTSFGSSQNGAARIVNVIGNEFIANINTSSYLSTYIRGFGSWQSQASLPVKVSSFDIKGTGADTFPIIAITDDASYGRIYRGNISFKWDSLGSSSKFTNDKLQGAPAVLATKARNIFVAYQDQTTWKIIVRQFCAPVTNNAVSYGLTKVLCPGTTKKLSAVNNLASVTWYKNDTLIAGSAGGSYTVTKPGTYKALLKNICGDSLFSSDIQITLSALIKPVVAINGSTLTVQNNGYSGIIWQLNKTDISGANAYTYTPSASGSFRVVVANSDLCFDSSEAVNFWMAGTRILNIGNLTLYPNPVQNKLIVNLAGNELVCISDYAGKTVWNEKVSGTAEINTAAWPAGIYLLKTSSGTAGKIIKQ
ncbi:MAG: T9SS type A sorting domain-containing protein [Bacteroidetes bacterium]|nr:T9SS type A sorting domain-containing protein [Bacteroidota bacterium]